MPLKCYKGTHGKCRCKCRFQMSTHSEFSTNTFHNIIKSGNHWWTETEENHNHFTIKGADLQCPENKTNISPTWRHITSLLQATVAVTPSDHPLPTLHQICTVDGHTVCYITSKNVCSRMKHFVIQLLKQKAPALLTSAFKSATLSCSSRTFSLSSRLLRSSPSVTISSFWGHQNATSYTKPLHKEAIVVVLANAPLTFSSNSEVFCFS